MNENKYRLLIVYNNDTTEESEMLKCGLDSGIFWFSYFGENDEYVTRYCEASLIRSTCTVEIKNKPAKQELPVITWS